MQRQGRYVAGEMLPGRCREPTGLPARELGPSA